MTFLKDFTKIQKLHWLAFPHSYNNSADVDEKMQVYNELAKDLEILSILKKHLTTIKIVGMGTDRYEDIVLIPYENEESELIKEWLENE